MSLEPPPDEARLVAITGLQEAACLRCDRRIRDVGTLRADGRERCGACTSLNYLIAAPAAGVAIVTQVTARELAYAQRAQLSTHAFLAFLGLAAPFVPAPVLAPDGPGRLRLPRLPQRP